MIKKFAVLAILPFLFASAPTYAGIQRTPLPAATCAPLTKYVKNITDMIICRTGYVSLYNPSAKIPDVVIYEDNRQKLAGCFKRSNAFAPDNSIGDSPKPKDYMSSGYDKGHMAPDDDMRYDLVVEQESFIMTNMTPQLPNFNRGIWKSLEEYSRNTAYANDGLIILSGSIYKPLNQRLKGREIIPDAFYKILIDTKNGTTQSFIIPQIYSSKNLQSYIVTVADVTRASGVNFDLNYRELSVLGDPANEPDNCGK